MQKENKKQKEFAAVLLNWGKPWRSKPLDDDFPPDWREDDLYKAKSKEEGLK